MEIIMVIVIPLNDSPDAMQQADGDVLLRLSVLYVSTPNRSRRAALQTHLHARAEQEPALNREPRKLGLVVLS